MPFWKTLFLIIFPGGLLFALAVYQQTTAALPESLQGFRAIFPPLAAAVGLLLGWRFNRSRVIWTALLIILVERALTESPSYLNEYGLAVSFILLPIDLMLLGWWSERGLFTMHGLGRGLFFAAQSGCAAWLYQSHAGEVIAMVREPLYNLPGLGAWPVPQIPLLVFIFCLLALLARAVQKPEALEVSFCWALLAVGAGFWWSDSFAHWGAVAILILALAVIESSFSMAFNDELTGLPTRRAMNEYLLKVGRRYTVAMVDIDHFKKVNDTHGHDVGDQVLRMVATCLRRVTGGGRAYRYGGEEFALIFPGKSLEKALPHLEGLRQAVARTGFTVRGRRRPKKRPEKPVGKRAGNKQLKVTVSIGAADRDDRNITADQLIKAADQALYRAKKNGRDQVCT